MDLRHLEDLGYEIGEKEHESDQTIWLHPRDTIGEHCFTIDGKRIYNIFRDYPHGIDPADREIFDRETPFGADFFADRK